MNEIIKKKREKFEKLRKELEKRRVYIFDPCTLDNIPGHKHCECHNLKSKKSCEEHKDQL